MKQSIELLSPAKDAAYGKEAIKHGADAVYIGAPRYGARAAVGNTLKDIEKLVKYAHFYKAKVYVALNTLLYDHELDDAALLIHQFHSAGIDALIIQDMGLLELALPPIPLFASTQTHNVDAEKVSFLERAGFSRVILARELSLPQITDIRAKTQIDLEAFVHGALCVCYSGQCYLSQHLTQRSGNRGVCAQPCRSSYHLEDNAGNILVKKNHLLSLKDLNLSNHLQSLLEAGITSFKIEGRLKDLSYVKNITAYYRQALDRILETDQRFDKSSIGKSTFHFEPDPEKTFNRGYTHYFLSGQNTSCGSPLTQKSLGKSIGYLESRRGAKLLVRSSQTIVPGDGLCYFGSTGILEGFLVNQTEGSWITPAKGTNILPGTELYRNLDIAFLKMLNGNSADRKIGITLHLANHPKGCTLTVADEENLTATYLHELITEEARDKELARTHMVKQLSKLGDAPFILTQPVDIDENICRFFPTAILNDIRRNTIQMLMDKRTRHNQQPPPPPRTVSTFPNQTLDYRANVLNQKSKEFYQRHFVTHIESGWEFTPPKGKAILMTTRYCIRAQYGQCIQTNPDSPWRGPLFLKDGKNTFPLTFDCILCQMHLETEEAKSAPAQKGR